jgi:hypothetical protein
VTCSTSMPWLPAASGQASTDQIVRAIQVVFQLTVEVAASGKAGKVAEDVKFSQLVSGAVEPLEDRLEGCRNGLVFGPGVREKCIVRPRLICQKRLHPDRQHVAPSGRRGWHVGGRVSVDSDILIGAFKVALTGGGHSYQRCL